MDFLFWWAADAMRQPENKGCLCEFCIILLIFAVGFLIGTFIWG